MPTAMQVHWHEGMFLQPHHLQAMQRQVQSALHDRHRLSCAYPWGLMEYRLSRDALDNMRVQFDRLSSIMPSGVEVDVPGAADLPPLDIQKAFAAGSGALTIRLAVPLWQSQRANAIDPTQPGDGAARRLYRVDQFDQPDENTGANPQPLPVRRVNARLLLPDDDATDLETMPVLRLVHSTEQGEDAPRIDPAFIPPCLLVSGYPRLAEMIRDMAHHAQAIRASLAARLKPGFAIEQVKGASLRQMLKLRTFNVYAARLSSLVAAPGLTPFGAYLELRSMLGELAALHPDRDPWDVPEYDHDEPMLAFDELCRRIRNLGPETSGEGLMKVEFKREKACFVARLEKEHLTQPNEYFLAVASRSDPRELAKLIEDRDRFKLMPEKMANAPVWGIPLAEERNPPLELPTQSGMSYFRLLRTDNPTMWERVQQQGALAAVWPGMDNADYKLTLYMTVPTLE